MGRIIEGFQAPGVMLEALGFRLQLVSDPNFDSLTHLTQSPFEEMIGCFDQNELIRLGQRADYFLELCFRPELVACSRYEEFRLCTRLEEGEVVITIVNRSDRYA